jgi:hypothetical protein
MLAGAALGGVIQAGDLDPTGPVGSTMKSLDDLVPSWNRALDSTGGCDSERFECVLDGAAVLDRETGLVWERQPTLAQKTYTTTYRDCIELIQGDRFGWRLPTAEELSSLKMPGGGLPDGHPFIGVPIDAGVLFWSSTTVPQMSANAYAVTFGNLNPQSTIKTEAVAHTWCVRGGHGHDGV